MFVSLDGIDGGGKTTQMDLLQQWLEKEGETVVRFRDPGSTPLGEAVREILLNRHDIPLAPTAEMLLYMACRAQLVSQQIQPALDQGKIVLCDRYLLANVVYQGCGGALPLEPLWDVGKVATAGLLPDLLVVLDLPVAVSRSRLPASRDRLEQRDDVYFERVRQGFIDHASRGGKHSLIVDATEPIDQVQSKIRSAFELARRAKHKEVIHAVE